MKRKKVLYILFLSIFLIYSAFSYKSYKNTLNILLINFDNDIKNIKNLTRITAKYFFKHENSFFNLFNEKLIDNINFFNASTNQDINEEILRDNSIESYFIFHEKSSKVVTNSTLDKKYYKTIINHKSINNLNNYEQSFGIIRLDKSYYYATRKFIDKTIVILIHDSFFVSLKKNFSILSLFDKMETQNILNINFYPFSKIESKIIHHEHDCEIYDNLVNDKEEQIGYLKVKICKKFFNKLQNEIKINSFISYLVFIALLIILIVVVNKIIKKNVEINYKDVEIDKLNIISKGIAHELKNPMNTISMLAQVEFSKNRNNNLKAIIDHINLINHKINALLKLAKQILPNRSNSNMIEFIKENLSKYRVNSDIEINFSHEKDELFYSFDSILFQNVFDNLISNSIKALENIEKKTIDITAIEKSKFVIIEYNDNGCGIKKENLDKIFLPSFSFFKKGSGLGLSITKKIIEAHNGEISVISKGINQGINITIKLSK